MAGYLCCGRETEEHDINSQTAVRKTGYPVAGAENGYEALKILEKEHFRLILMDVQMPELNGIQATEQIRQNEDPDVVYLSLLETHIPIIAFTAHVFERDKEECFRAGMNDWIMKPVDREEFLKKIQKWLPPD